MTAKKRWSDLSPGLRTALRVAISTQLALLATAQVDISRRPAEQINGSKWKWRLVTLINFAGPITYFVKGVRRRRLS